MLIRFHCHSSITSAPDLSPNQLQKPPILLADLSSLLKRAAAFLIKAAKIALNIANVELEIAPYDIPIVSRRLWITRNKWPRWRDTSFGGDISGQ